MRDRSSGKLLVWEALAVVAACAAYETSLALGWVATRSENVQWIPPLLGGLALVVIATVFALAGASVPRIAVSLAVLAGAALLAARFYTFDPYYLPTLRRLSDGGVLSPRLVYALLGVSPDVAVLALVRRRLGMLVSIPLLLVVAGTVWFAATGH